MTSVLTRNGRLRMWVVPTLVVLIVACAAAAMLIGRFSVSLEDVVAALRARFWGGPSVSPRINSVVFDLRAPRIIVAILIGGGLSVAGASFQSLFSNPLATPDTLGVAAGTCVGAVIALLLDWNLIGVQAAALAAGLATMAFTTAISRTRTGAFNVITLVLGGVIVSALANAVLSLLKLTADPTSQLPEITYWLMGSLAAVTYHQIALGAPFIIAGVVIIVALRWQLNILSLSEDEARSAGVNVSLMRAILIIASTVITASVISMCGQVGWVGLLVPHCARMLCGQNNRAVIPVSLLLDWNLIGVQAAALGAGLATMTFTTAIARTRTGSFNVITLVLGGVIVSALANAVLSLLKLTADPTSQLPEITYWLMGSLAAVTYRQIALGAPFIIGGIVVIVALRWQLNILSLSEDEARTAGVNVSLMRAVLIVASTVITASVISMCGQVGWVGLLVPHCARMLCGQNNRAVIPVSALLGSALMIVIDTLARSLSASEIPISILTAIIGAPFFIVLLRRTGGAR